MCGRFAQTFTTQELMNILQNLDLDGSDIAGIKAEPSWNIAPTHAALVIAGGDKPSFRRVAWGLGQTHPKSFLHINARSETVDTKPLFREAWTNRRCLIPVSGFYEWKQGATGKNRTPWLFRMSRFPVYCLGGILFSEGLLESFVVLTTMANAAVAALHERMPVILSPADYPLWLEPHSLPPETAIRLCTPLRDELFAGIPVLPVINNARINRCPLRPDLFL